MTTIHRHPLVSPSEHSGASIRADRLLRAMHKVFSHDLPNQMVALQSLLQLLDREEAGHLGAEGREYVRRLHNATKRASDMVRFLKEMGRLNALAVKKEPIGLVALARELQGELLRRYPRVQFTFAWHWRVASVVGDGRVYLQALLELFARLMPTRAQECRILGTAEQLGQTTELTFQLEATQAPADVAALNPQALEQGMEFILAREWLALSGAGVEMLPIVPGDLRFSIVTPNR